MEHPDDLWVRVYPDTETIPLLDQFETISDNGVPKYKRLVLRGWDIPYGAPWDGIVHLVIERGLYGVEIAGSLTFTALKRRQDSHFHEFLMAEIRSNLGNEPPPDDVLIPFTKPYMLRAQNSTNLAGWHREGDRTVIRPGTEYGETTRYHIVGMYVSHYDDEEPEDESL